MTTIIKVIIATLISLMFFSCDFNSGVQGNGNVQTEERLHNETFSSIDVSEGLDVYLSESDIQNISVEADENLHKLIITEVIDDVLKIHTSQNIRQAHSKKVMVSFKGISKIKSASGSRVYSTNIINSERLELSTSSGSTMKVNLNANILSCKASSGSTLNVSGKTDNLTAKSSSGSSIKAEDLNAISSNATASSGSSIIIKTSKELTANASSGGSVRYYGLPEKVNKSNSSGGSISKK
tara:strand:+ start:7656 stop:8372 length:717 start_codon:yes stop_codon:yes gene_type:complete